jgi:hypothetical protein
MVVLHQRLLRRVVLAMLILVVYVFLVNFDDVEIVRERHLGPNLWFVNGYFCRMIPMVVKSS